MANVERITSANDSREGCFNDKRHRFPLESQGKSGQVFGGLIAPFIPAELDFAFSFLILRCIFLTFLFG